MKKTYFSPEMEVVEVEINNALLAGSVPGADGGSDDGSQEPEDGGDPTDPDWGSGF